MADENGGRMGDTVLTTPVSTADAAYFAGFVDADGSIAIYRGVSRWPNYRAQVTAAQIDLEPLRMLQRAFGGYIDEQKRRGNRRRNYRWRLTGHPQVKHMLEQIAPYLVVKKNESSLALDFIRIRVKSTRSAKGNPMFSAWDIAEQESYVEAVKQMKAERGTTYGS